MGWLHQLLARGTLHVPVSEAARLRETLLLSGTSDVAGLPAELRTDIVDTTPRAHLALRSSGPAGRFLQVDVRFSYDGGPAQAASTAPLAPTRDPQTMARRKPDAERLGTRAPACPGGAPSVGVVGTATGGTGSHDRRAEDCATARGRGLARRSRRPALSRLWRRPHPAGHLRPGLVRTARRRRTRRSANDAAGSVGRPSRTTGNGGARRRHGRHPARRMGARLRTVLTGHQFRWSPPLHTVTAAHTRCAADDHTGGGLGQARGGRARSAAHVRHGSRPVNPTSHLRGDAALLPA